MIKVENFPKAYKEVYAILQNINEKDKEIIPDDFMKIIKDNMQQDYNFEIAWNEDFEDKDILQETKTILAYVFLNYWGTDEQKVKIRKKFRNDIALEENKKIYNSDDLFKDRKEHIKQSEPELQIIKYNSQSLFNRIINKIKSLIMGRR